MIDNEYSFKDLDPDERIFNARAGGKTASNVEFNLYSRWCG